MCLRHIDWWIACSQLCCSPCVKYRYIELMLDTSCICSNNSMFLNYKVCITAF